MIVREVTGLKTRNKVKLLEQFEQILRDNGIIKEAK